MVVLVIRGRQFVSWEEAALGMGYDEGEDLEVFFVIRMGWMGSGGLDVTSPRGRLEVLMQRGRLGERSLASAGRR